MSTGIGRPLRLAILIALFAKTLSAQQHSAPAPAADLRTYDTRREVALLGTVLSFTPASQTPPLGAHLTLQTAAGLVDVHLGDPRFLAANQFDIKPGDLLRIIGENLTSSSGRQFVARIVQNGTKILALRSVRGIPLSYMAPRSTSASHSYTGEL